MRCEKSNRIGEKAKYFVKLFIIRCENVVNCNANCRLLLFLLYSTGVDDEGVDDDEENVGNEDDVERHAVHLLGPAEEPVHLGILFHFVADTFLKEIS